MLIKIFGSKKDNIIYKERIGVYGIGFSTEGKIPVIMKSLADGNKRYYLLGGGIENGETQEECLKRECLEEAGLSVNPKHLVCVGEYYHVIEPLQTDFHAIGHFYYMDVANIVSIPTELDHALVWLDVEEIKEKLFLPHQIWAVEQVLKMERKE